MAVTGKIDATSSPRADRFSSALSIGCPYLCPAALTPSLILDFQLPPSAWATVLQRVEQGEPLRQVARAYGVSYETVRRVLRAARRR